MDWFRGKLEPENPIFHGKKPWVSCKKNPLNQSNDSGEIPDLR
jgi:hypothetical protein